MGEAKFSYYMSVWDAFWCIFSLKSAEKSKKHILGKRNQTDLASAAWREAGKNSKIIREKDHTSVI